MALTRLQDDLLQEFREEKRLISGQIEIFNPLAMSLRKPAAQRLAASGAIIFGEVMCWLAAPGCIALAIFLKRIYPFYILFQAERPEHAATLGAGNVQALQWAAYGLIGLIGVLFIIVANMLGRIRRKNAVLNLAGKHIKTLVGQHLNRKAAIDAIEQRHFLEMPVAAQPVSQPVNDVLNPGFDPGAFEGEGVERVKNARPI